MFNDGEEAVAATATPDVLMGDAAGDETRPKLEFVTIDRCVGFGESTDVCVGGGDDNDVGGEFILLIGFCLLVFCLSLDEINGIRGKNARCRSCLMKTVHYHDLIFAFCLNVQKKKPTKTKNQK